VLDDFNTFQHVTECLMKYIPGMTSDRAWELTNQVHYEGQALVWVGPQEQAELYHQQLRRGFNNGSPRGGLKSL